MSGLLCLNECCKKAQNGDPLHGTPWRWLSFAPGRPRNPHGHRATASAACGRWLPRPGGARRQLSAAVREPRASIAHPASAAAAVRSDRSSDGVPWTASTSPTRTWPSTSTWFEAEPRALVWSASTTNCVWRSCCSSATLPGCHSRGRGAARRSCSRRWPPCTSRGSCTTVSCAPHPPEPPPCARARALTCATYAWSRRPAGLSSSSVLVCHAGGDSAAAPDGSNAPTLKLADWCLHHTTAGGTLAPCLAGDPQYLAPELVVAGPARAAAMGAAGAQQAQSATVATAAAGGADIWAIGILLVELILGTLPAPLCGPAPASSATSTAAEDILRGVLEIARARAGVRAGAQARAHAVAEAGGLPTPYLANCWPAAVSSQFCAVEEPLQRLVERCLEPHDVHRPSAKALLRAHKELAGHPSASKLSQGASTATGGYIISYETESHHVELQPSSAAVVPPVPPPVPIQGGGGGGGGGDQVAQAAPPTATIAAAATTARTATVRRLCEHFFAWLADSGGDTDAVDALILAAIKRRRGYAMDRTAGASASASASTASRLRSRLGLGLGRPMYGFPMLTFRDRLYSVAVDSDHAHGWSDNPSDASTENAHDYLAVLPLSSFAVTEAEPEAVVNAADASQTTVDISSTASSEQRAATKFDAAVGAAGIGLSTEPQRLSITPSRHHLWDGCSAHERQQLRVAAIADANLPIPLRERHRGYQEDRVAHFRTLLEKAPLARSELVRAAQTDIPPVLRAEIWPHLLGLSTDSLNSDTMLTLPTDSHIAENGSTLDEKTRKQIDVDLPRCHQENAILASEEGQTCLRLVLEAWLETHAQSSVYCQGLDSLAAPFVILFFHRCCCGTSKGPDTDADPSGFVDMSSPADQGGASSLDDDNADTERKNLLQSAADGWSELSPHAQTAARMRPAVQPAYCCLVAFTGMFLNRIFASGSTSMLRAQLAEFSELLAAELPELGTHFRSEGVTAELFAIPWLLTLFAHVLPLPNILQLWDVLLAHGDDPHVESLPLYVAISIVRQSEAQLLALDFNGILLHLSRLPPIDLDLALREAVVSWKAPSRPNSE